MSVAPATLEIEPGRLRPLTERVINITTSVIAITIGRLILDPFGL